MQAGVYTGRFAPSPTGPLHAGSLYAALASWLDARACNGRWLLRIEDLDPPRESPEAADLIITALEKHGLTWDGPILWQSTRSEEYRSALETLLGQGEAFYCGCSRRDLAATAGMHHRPCITPRETDEDAAVRLAMPPLLPGFQDQLQGSYPEAPSPGGDMVLRRRDGLWAYQLAVVVDDALQGITHVVRGQDLLDSTPAQIALQKKLGYPTPAYAHVPILIGEDGAKLSKRSFATPLDNADAGRNLWQALQLLQQHPPAPLRGAAPGELLAWAVENWHPEHLTGIAQREAVPPNS